MSNLSEPTGRGSRGVDRRTTTDRLALAALRHRVRTITDGEVELDPSQTAGSVVGAVVGGQAFYQTGDLRGLGPALRWARANGADRLIIIAEGAAASGIARRAALLDADITVWRADGTEVRPAESAPAPVPPVIPASHRRFDAVIAGAGARPVDDHGMLVAEVAGLEVARVQEAEPGGEPRLVVGVGQADRELQQYIHGHLDVDANLRRAVAAVIEHRHTGSAGHPLTRVARQRWLRSSLLDDPGMIGLAALEPVVPLRPRETLLGDEPAAARGESAVVVCSVGVDLDLLPEAADYRHRVDPEAELIVVVPERDRGPATSALAGIVPRLLVTSIDLPWDPVADA